jgi:hypothetical protein
MSEFFQLGHCCKDLISLNTVSKFQNLLHLLDILKCDSVTLDEFVISDNTESSYLHIFIQEHPTPPDFWMWKEAILQLCLGTTTLPTVLGRQVRPPHSPHEWFAPADNSQLYRIGNDPTCPFFCTKMSGKGTGPAMEASMTGRLMNRGYT